MLGFAWAQLAGAQSRPVEVKMPDPGDALKVDVSLNKSQVLDFPRPVKILSIGNPDVADVVVVRASQVYVLGKSLGNTNVVLWDENEKVQGTLNIHVTHDLEALKANLHQLLPDEQIQVRSSNGKIILTGELSSADRMDAAMRLATGFAGVQQEGEPPPILNLMQVGGAQQVMLEVKVAEVSRTLMKRLDVQFNFLNIADSALKVGGVNGGATFPDALFEPDGVRLPVFDDFQTPIGPMIDEFAPIDNTIKDVGLFASYLEDDWLLNLILDAGNTEGVAKILAEPNLTTLTGEQAKFLAGGEFPIPVPQREGQVTIEYKEFGVSLGFLPVILNSGVINLQVSVAVSDLISANSVITGLGDEASRQLFVPALSKRSAHSTVELGNGQTIAIAGMLNERLRENVDKFPGLGDIPILGQLFRSQEFRKEQTELVIFVTPRLAKPITPEEIRLPTGSFVAPSDWEYYLLGRYHPAEENRDEAENRAASAQANANANPGARADIDPLLNRRDGGTEGRFGHDL
ncbi:type II and III secretion system protein family protein [Proteobacteria bacterium 005FR1]|nr:type II and III secretion system protein family protein [Proteobacteria bacterium 005FR1]